MCVHVCACVCLCVRVHGCVRVSASHLAPLGEDLFGVQPALLADVAEGGGAQLGGGVAFGPGLFLGSERLQRLAHSDDTLSDTAESTTHGNNMS